MKKFYTSLMVLATVAMAFSSCSKEVDVQEDVPVSGKMKTITVKTDIATRTTLDSGHENIVWAGGEKISLFNDQNNTITELSYSAGGDITVEVPAATNEIYMHYPHYAENTNGPTSVSVYISNAQTQNDPGELNGYYFPMVAKGTVSADNKALVKFYPVAGALALNIYKSTLGETETETVESVKVTPAAVNTGFYGSQSTDITADAVKYTSANGTGDAVTVTLTNGQSLASAAPTNKQTFAGQIYVCLAKQSYANVKFEIKTDKGTYTITSNSTAFDLVNNDFVPVNINLASQNATFEEKPTAVDPTAFNWGLVKDALTVGDKVVIAAAESNVAMSTTQNNNNRGQITITKSGTSLTAVADVQVFEVVAGSKSNTIALKCLNGSEIEKYIAAASSSSNNMHSVDAVNDNASWNITIDGDTGIADVTAQGSYTRNILKYNSGNSVFSCYGSTNTMADVVFYRPTLPSANLSFPQESYTVNLGESFTAPELSNPYNVAVTYSSSASTIAAVDASTGAVTIGSAAGKATITATFTGNSTYSFTEASYEINVIDPNVERWVKTAIGSISSNDVFVIVGGGYAVPNDASGTPSAIAIAITNEALSDIPAASLQWKLTGNSSDGYSFSPVSDASKFLYCSTKAASSSNDNIRVGTGDRKVWEFDDDGYMITKDSYVVRYFSKYNNQDWRGYINTSNGAVALEFYVKQGESSTPTKTLSSITVTPPTKTTYTVGDTFDATGMVVTATYSDASTADVTAAATTDFTTQVATAGSKTVTVSYEENGVTKTDTFGITVSAAPGGDDDHPDIVITLDCSQNVFELSTSSTNDAAQEITKTVGDYSYKLYASNSCYYYQSKALFIGKKTSYITFPAIANYKLYSVKASNCAGASANASISIVPTSDTEPVNGGEASTIAAGGNHTWTLTSTVANTEYRIYIGNAYNIQFTEIVLTYKYAN